MPSLTFSQAMTANQLGLNPLSGWQFEYLPWRAVVKIIVDATTTGVRNTVYAGSQTIQERSPVKGGGTAGVIPADLSTSPIVFIAQAGDRLKVLLDEVAGGTPTVNLIVYAEPA